MLVSAVQQSDSVIHMHEVDAWVFSCVRLFKAPMDHNLQGSSLHGIIPAIIHMHIPTFWDSIPIKVIREYWVEFPVLSSRSLLAIYFIYSSMYMSIPISSLHLCIWICMLYAEFSPVRLCDPVDCVPPGSSVHGILQARVLKWVAMPSSRGSSQPRDRICVSYVSCICRWVCMDIPDLNYLKHNCVLVT